MYEIRDGKTLISCNSWNEVKQYFADNEGALMRFGMGKAIVKRIY